MQPTVTVADYGMGNLLSVSRAFESLGAKVQIADRTDLIVAAERLVLPGVGAFANGMRELEMRGLVGAISKFAISGKPLLGICLGMQMLFDSSEEFGTHAGLGLVSGSVRAIPRQGSDGRLHKIPHIGWSELRIGPARSSWHNTILADLQPGDTAYFVHSFTVHPADEIDRLADCDYDGCVVSASVHRNNLWGCQFHPEKSGQVGLSILRRFISLR